MKRIVDYLKNQDSEDTVVKVVFDNILYYQAINTDRKTEDFSGALYNYFVHECVRNNQYLSLSKKEFDDIHELYKRFIFSLRALRIGNISLEDIRKIVKQHRNNLIEIISKKYDKDEEILVPCSEYSVTLQLKVLRIGAEDINSPVIDIGCGKDARLVKYLGTTYRDVYGIDQYYSRQSNIICENWLDFVFMPDTWGTIISHMAFTNHFRRAMTYRSDKAGKYEEKYKEILSSLQHGGKFIYSPGVPEMEKQLDPEEYKINRFCNMDNNPLMSTVHITRI